MRIELINKRNYPINDKLKDVIAKKMSKLEKYFDEDIPVKVYLKSEGKRNKLEIQLKLGKNIMNAGATCEHMYDAIDKVLPKIEKQIVKHKGRLTKSVKMAQTDDNYLFAESYKKTDAITKMKEFNLESMTKEEALYEMDMSGHDFYVFVDEKDNVMKILYKRYDEDYGLIVPRV